VNSNPPDPGFPRVPRFSRLARIVLAEDNPGDVLLVRDALDLCGLLYSLDHFPDGQQVIQHFEEIEAGRQTCPEMVLLDLNLPLFTGIEVLIRIRAVCPAVPVIVVSASGSERDRAEAVRFGATRYFRKPVVVQEYLKLGSVVRQTLFEAER
jgi:chemotaxis family two-component system response regulator Rcp1